MTQTFKARKMVPGKDTLSVMALHYGITDATIIEVVRQASADVIRADGFHGFLENVKNGDRGRPKRGWSDGEIGVDPATTKLTRTAIRAVACWKHQQPARKDGDN